MIVTVEINGFIVRAKYWPAEISAGTPADVELLEVYRFYGKRKVNLPYERFNEIDERKLFKLVNETLLEESRDTSDVGDGFNIYNPYSSKFETK